MLPNILSKFWRIEYGCARDIEKSEVVGIEFWKF